MRECDVEPSAALELPERNEEEEHCDRAESPWTNDQDEAVAEVNAALKLQSYSVCQLHSFAPRPQGGKGMVPIKKSLI